MDRLLSVRALAEYLGIPVNRIYTMRWRKQAPPAVRVGKELRFRESDVVAWLTTLGDGIE